MVFATYLIAASFAAFPLNLQPAERVTKMRAKAVEFLVSQAKDGRWDHHWPLHFGNMDYGLNSLVASALLEAGLKPDDPNLAPVVASLADAEPKNTYAVSLQIRVLTTVDPKKHSKKIQQCADWLADTALRKDGARAWTYRAKESELPDISNTAYAVEALDRAVAAGAVVKPVVWGEVRELLVRSKTPSGWRYVDRPNGRVGYGMTTEALTALMIADARLGKPNEKATDLQREAWTNWAELYPHGKFGDPGRVDKSIFARAFATARLGRLIGKQTVRVAEKKDVEWYRDGVDWLAEHQGADGSWSAETDNSPFDKHKVIATSFALLFLGKP